MNLYENAIESIQIGVEDFFRGEDRRMLPAVRNVHAGVLLLCKEKLRRLSPDDELLLFQKFEPKAGADGKVSVVPLGHHTVGIEEIKKRFKDCNVALEWKRFEAISKIRNEIEHSYFKGARERAREALADAFVLIRHLLSEVLREDPREKTRHGVSERPAQEHGAVRGRTAILRETLQVVAWETDAARDALAEVVCPSCQSSLVRQRDPDNKKQLDLELYCSGL